MRRIRVVIYGRVTGVLFRAYVKKVADDLNIKGWVKNLDRNMVEAAFEGNISSIEKMLEFCRKGPIGAKVDKVDVKEEEYKAEFKTFRILY